MTEKHAFLVKISPLVLIALNIIIKIVFITTNSIGGDEPFSIYYAQMDIPLIISNLSQGNNPPLYEILLHFWIKLFGIGPLAVRLPSLIFSTATVYFIYRIGKDFFNYKIALLAALLFTFSNFHIFFAHEARVYPLFALLTTMSMYYFLKICQNRTVFRSYILLLVVTILLLYAHYFSAFVIIIQSLFILIDGELRRKQLRNYLLFLLSIIVLYSPYILILFNRFVDSSQNGTWISKPNGVEAIYNMLWSFSNSPITTVASITILLAALIKVIVNKDFKHISIASKLVVTWFIFPFFTMFIVSFWIPMFIGRYLIFLSLGYYLLLAMSSIYLVKSKRYQFVIPGILLILFVFTVKLNIGNKRHVKETIAKIAELKDSNTVVLVCPQFFDLNFTYYFSPKVFREANQPNALNNLHEKMKKEGVSFVYSINDMTIDKTKKVLYLDVAAQSSYPNNKILPTIEKNHQLANTYTFYEVFTLYEFQCKN